MVSLSEMICLHLQMMPENCMRIIISTQRECAIEKTGRGALELELVLEVKGVGFWASTWAEARDLEKKLDRSWTCPPIKQFSSQSWLCLQEKYLHYTALMLCNIQTSAYILKTSPNLPLHTYFGDSKTYAQEAIKSDMNRGAFGKGKRKCKRKNRYSSSYHGNKNVDNPRISEKRRLSKGCIWIFCEQMSMVNKLGILKLEEVNHIILSNLVCLLFLLWRHCFPLWDT